MKTTIKSIVGLKELRENMEIYVSGVQKGKSYVVVRRSQPIFRLVPFDVWGDEGVWETAVDFTQIAKKGVRIDEVVNSLKKLNEQNR